MKKSLRFLLEDVAAVREYPIWSSLLVDKEADNIVVSGEHESRVFDVFEEFVRENYSRNARVDVYASEDYRDDISGSGSVHEEAVDFFEYPSTTSQVTEVLSSSGTGDRTVILSDRDYMEEVSTLLGENKDGQNVINIYS